MEPKILLIGRGLNTLEILKDELLKFDRTVFIANTNELIVKALENESIDIAIVGAGLPDETITSMADLIRNTTENIEVEIMEKKPGLMPASMIGFANEKAIMWKIRSV